TNFVFRFATASIPFSYILYCTRKTSHKRYNNLSIYQKLFHKTATSKNKGGSARSKEHRLSSAPGQKASRDPLLAFFYQRQRTYGNTVNSPLLFSPIFTFCPLEMVSFNNSSESRSSTFFWMDLRSGLAPYSGSN